MPMRRSRLVLSALIVGTMAPDFEYFLRLRSGSGWGHTIPGAFGLSLPLGLAVLWLYHRFAKLPIAALLPVPLELRLGQELQPFRFRGRFFLIVLSMLAGIATHLAWDSFTHSHTWLFHHWDFLRRHVHLPLAGSIRVFLLLQYISSIGGIVVLLCWVWHWNRTTAPGPQPLSNTFTPGQKGAITAAMLAGSTAGGVVRALASMGIPHTRATIPTFAGEAVITLGALLWWQLVAWGVLLRTGATRLAPQTELAPR